MAKKNWFLLLLISILATSIVSLSILYYINVISKPVVIINSDIEKNVEAYISDIYSMEKENKTYIMLNVATKKELQSNFIDKILFRYSDDFNKNFTEIFLAFNSSNQSLLESFIFSTDDKYFPKELQNKAYELRGNINPDNESRDVRLINEDFGIVINIPRIELSKAKYTDIDLREYFKIRKIEVIK